MFRILTNALVIIAFACWPGVLFAKDYSGSAWRDNTGYRYNGSSWDAVTKNRYNGSSWDEIEATGEGGPDDTYDAQVTFGASTQTGGNFKVLIYNSDTSNLIATATPGVVAVGVVTVVFPSPVTLSAETSYQARVITDTIGMVLSHTGAGDLAADATGSYASPATTLDAGWAESAQAPCIVIRNSSTTTLLGSGSVGGSTGSLGVDVSYGGYGEVY